MQRKPTSKVHRIAGRTKIAMLPQFPCERTSAIGRDGPKRSEHLQQRMLTEGNYSMTSSARASNEGGTVKPMAPGLCSSVAGTRPNCDDLALHRFFPGSVGDDEAACRLHVLFDPARDHAVMQRANLHGLDLATSSFLVLGGCAAIGAPAP